MYFTREKTTLKSDYFFIRRILKCQSMLNKKNANDKLLTQVHYIKVITELNFKEKTFVISIKFYFYRPIHFKNKK